MPHRIHDSTKTRVIPVFDALVEADDTGRDWLPDLLALPQHGNVLRDVSIESDLTSGEWGDNERGLIPPRNLLLWLLENAASDSPACWNRSEKTNKQRERLLKQKDQELLREASERLCTSSYVGKAWYYFEGKTWPDVFLENDEFLIVIEGKRTESSTTTKTDWMPVRHQMIRHLDCAYEIRGDREVLAFFIVEGEGSFGSVPKKWIKLSNATLDPDAVSKSLPHRSQQEQQEIMAGFLGITTWQQLCRKLKLPLETLRDVAPQ